MKSTDSRSDVAPRSATKSVNRLFDALGNDRRRTVLSYLREASDDGASVAELTKELAKQGSDGDGAPIERGIEGVATSLHHVNLPKLDASGLVNYDV